MIAGMIPKMILKTIKKLKPLVFCFVCFLPLIFVSCSCETDVATFGNYYSLSPVPEQNVGKTAYLIVQNMQQKTITPEVYARLVDKNGNVVLANKARANYSTNYSNYIDYDNYDYTDAYGLEKNDVPCIDCGYLRRNKDFAPFDPSAYINKTNKNRLYDVSPQKENDFDACLIGEQKDVWVIYETDENEYYKRPFTLKVQTQHFNVWQDSESQVTISSSTEAKLQQNLEKIFDLETQIFGSNEIQNPYFVATPQKINIFVYDLDPKDTGVAGFFYNFDLYTQDAIDHLNGDAKKAENQKEEHSSQVHSNQMQCFYINETMLGRPILYSVLSHEFQHMLCFINKFINQGATNTQMPDTWYTEMLSVLAQDITAKTLDITTTSDLCNCFTGYISAFNAGAYRGFLNWDDNNETVLGYGNVYAFGSYLARRYGKGSPVAFIKSMAQNKKANDASVTQAIKDANFDITFDAALERLPEYAINGSWQQTQTEYIKGQMQEYECFLHSLSVSVQPVVYTSTNMYKILPLYWGGFFIVKMGVVKSGDKIESYLPFAGDPFLKAKIIYK